MSMIIHEVAQGTPEWHALRGDYFTASEAPAMMGASKQISRTELLDAKKTGLDRDVHWWVQKNLFDRGHEAEAMARPIVERIIGEDLYPVVGTRLGLLASLDGLTMLGNIVFEHKMWNAELAAQVSAGELDPHYYWQLEQQLLVAEAERAIFVVSDGTEENMVYLWYTPVEGRAKQLIAGWKQFEADLGEHEVSEAKPKLVAAAVDSLPAVTVKVSGSIALTDNFNIYEARLQHFLSEILIKEPRTDQDFVDLDLQIKELKKAEKALDAAEAQMLAQVESVDAAKRRKDTLAKLTRDNRLMAEDLLKTKKESIKREIKDTADAAFQKHIATINARLGKVRLPEIRADFAAPMKGKRSLTTMQDAVDTEMARLKIQANEIAENIDANLATLRELAVGHEMLFRDAQQLVLKANDDLIATINSRIGEFKQAEEARLEAERAKIRAEEQEKLRVEQEVKDKAAAEAKAKAEADAQAKVEAEAKANAAPETAEAPAEQPAAETIQAPRTAKVEPIRQDAPEPMPQWRAEVLDKVALIQHIAQHPELANLLDVNLHNLAALARTFKDGMNIPGVSVHSDQAVA